MKIPNWLAESFLSKASEKLVDLAHNTVKDVINFGCTLKTVRQTSTMLCANASDVEEQVKNAELSGKKKRKRQVEDWLNNVQAIEQEFHALDDELQVEGFFGKFVGGGRAAQLNARMDRLIEQSRHFGELLLDVLQPKGDAFLTTTLVGESFQKNLESIWNLLVIDKVSAVGIHGMGGAGKTTLAKHINNRLLVENQGHVIWVTVSQKFSIQSLQDEIARPLGLDLSDERDEDKRATRLNRALSRRESSTIILDDVWENINLATVGDPPHVDGCRLVITTRSLEVCRRIGCQVIGVNKLNEDEAWNLFTRTLGPEMTLASEVEETAKLLVAECDGLPLGIITLAGSMRGVTSPHAWRNALEELKEFTVEHPDMEDKVFKVLKYSFDRLDQREEKCGYTKLQRCFLYCSLYPEDYEISRMELIRKFISAELVDKRKSRGKQFDEGHAILDKLVDVCLLENISKSHGVYLKMHDLVRDMSLKITQGKTMVLAGHNLKKLPGVEEWTMDLETMSLMRNRIDVIPSGISPNCPRLSTLVLAGNTQFDSIDDSFFTQMRGLRILDLSQTRIRVLPNSLSSLESLNALLLENCGNLEYVPNLGKLKALRELNLSRAGIREVPEGIEQLVNLNLLALNGTFNVKMLPAGLLSRLSNLRCLFLPENVLAPIEEMERLEQLEEFSGRVKDACDFNRFIRYTQRQDHPITSYYIAVGGYSKELEIPRLPTVGNKVIIVSIDSPMKDVIMLGDDIQHLKYESCHGLRRCFLHEFPRLNNPRIIQTLKISDCQGIECILRNVQLVSSTAQVSEPHSLPFPKLEDIRLCKLPDFMGIIVDHREVLASSPPAHVSFSSLRRLRIHDCMRMKKLGLPLSELPNLESVYVAECHEMEELIETREGQQQFVSLPKLTHLGLCGNSRLKRICKATMKCPAIVEIIVWGNYELKKLPLHFTQSAAAASADGQPHYSLPSSTLKRVVVGREDRDREWWGSLEWDHPYHSHLLQPFLNFVLA